VTVRGNEIRSLSLMSALQVNSLAWSSIAHQLAAPPMIVANT
jgi:hypothetical protein